MKKIKEKSFNFKYLNAIIQCIFLDIEKNLLIILFQNFKKLLGEAGNVPLVLL